METERIEATRQLMSKDRFVALLKIELTDIHEHGATAEVTVGEQHLNGGNVAQGGLLFTLADFAMAAAANAANDHCISFSINSQMQFLVSAVKGERLTATARELYMHKSICHYSVEVRNEAQRLIANFTGTCYRKEIR